MESMFESQFVRAQQQQQAAPARPLLRPVPAPPPQPAKLQAAVQVGKKVNIYVAQSPAIFSVLQTQQCTAELRATI